MILDEIVVHNFGVYLNRQSIQLTPPCREKPVVLFGGLNGGGKTTLLDAFQLALYGKWARCSNRGDLAYEEFLRRCIHKASNPKEGATLEVQFRNISNGQEHTYRVHRAWLEKGKEIKEICRVIKDGDLDHVLTDAWSEHVEQFIPSRISHLFFFDSEKIEGFADPENSAQLLSIAIHSLLGLDTVDQLYQDLLVIEKRNRTTLKSDIDRKQIEKAKEESEQWDKHRDELIQTRAAAQNDLDWREKKLRELEERFRNEGGELFEQREEIETKRRSAEEDLRSLAEELREIAAGPAPLFLVAGIIEKIDQQDRLEESAIQAQGLNEILAERDEQLLRQAQCYQTPGEILVRIEKFLAEDRKRRAENAKTECYLELDSEARENLHGLISVVLPEIRERSTLVLEKAASLRSIVDDLDRKMAGIPHQDSIAQLIKDRQNAQLAIEEAKTRIGILDQELKRLNYLREQKQARLSSLIEKTLDKEFEKEDASRIISHSQKVRNTLHRFRSAVIARHVNRISQLVLDSFKQLLLKECLVNDLSINPENFTLELRDSGGKVLSPDRLSAGERQLLAISILWGLARASGQTLPAIIDTPLGRLDSFHRLHLVERYFPYASHQVLLLSTDEEIDQKYFEKLKPFIGRTYRLLFDDSLGATKIQPGYFW